jgi:hypothetical protein
MGKRKDLNSPLSSGETSTQLSAKQSLNGSYDDTVRERAYQLYESRMQSNNAGDPVSDWLQAEQLVRNEFAGQNDIFS